MKRRLSTDIKWVLGQLRPYLPAYSTSLVCIVIAGLMSLLDPLVMKWVIDKALPQQQLRWLPIAAGVFAFTYSCRLVFNGMGAMLSFRATQTVIAKLRLALLRHVQALSAAYHDNSAVGDTMYRIEQDVYNIGEFGGEAAISFARTFIITGMILLAMFSLSFSLTCTVLPLVPIFVIVRRRCNAGLRRWSELVQSQSANRTSFVQEHVSSIVQIQLLRGELTEARKFLRLLKAALESQYKRKWTELVYGVGSMLVFVIGIAILLGYGGYQVINHQLSVGGLVAFYTYLIRLFDPLSNAVDIDTKLQRARASIRRVLELMQTAPAVANRPDAITLPHDSPVVLQLRSVSFDYEAGREVLKRVDLFVRPGEKVALVGKTGSGKSTVGKLVTRLYDVREGSICLNGHDIRDIRLKNLRSLVALVPQEPVLLNGTIRDNLLLGNPQATNGDLEEGCRLAQLDELIGKLPRGWDEVVGPRGTRLSGGERQRLSVARALLQRPRVLILDESTSAIDSVTERRLLDALTPVVKETAVIVISHRLSTVLWADRIVVLDNCKIVEQGTHSQLLRRDGVYQRFCHESLQTDEPANELAIIPETPEECATVIT